VIRLDMHDRSWFQPLFFDTLYLHSIAFSSYAYVSYPIALNLYRQARTSAKTRKCFGLSFVAVFSPSSSYTGTSSDVCVVRAASQPAEPRIGSRSRDTFHQDSQPLAGETSSRGRRNNFRSNDHGRFAIVSPRGHSRRLEVRSEPSTRTTQTHHPEGWPKLLDSPEAPT
jgi:hypothetical protein